MLIIAPAGAAVGIMLVMVGAGDAIKVKLLPLPVPPGVVTDTAPELPSPMIALITVFEITLNEVASAPPNFTANTLSKFIPVMITSVPAVPVAGLIDETIGNG